MTRTARLLAAIAIGATALFVTATPASACTCVEVTEADALAQADAVFIGTVEAVDRPRRLRTSADPVTWTFSVERVFKGKSMRTQRILSPFDSGACGIEFERGTSHLVFATKHGENLWAYLYGGTRRAVANETPRGFPPASAPSPPVANGAAAPTRTPTQTRDQDEGNRNSTVDLSIPLVAAAAAAVVGMVVMVRWRGGIRRRSPKGTS